MWHKKTCEEGKCIKRALSASECRASQPLSLWKYYTIIPDILQGHARKDCCIIAYVRETECERATGREGERGRGRERQRAGKLVGGGGGGGGRKRGRGASL